MFRKPGHRNCIKSHKVAGRCEHQNERRTVELVDQLIKLLFLFSFFCRLCLREFCIEILQSAYNTLVRQVRRILERNVGSTTHDDSYLLWAIKFFMEFHRLSGLKLQLVRWVFVSSRFLLATGDFCSMNKIWNTLWIWKKGRTIWISYFIKSQLSVKLFWSIWISNWMLVGKKWSTIFGKDVRKDFICFLFSYLPSRKHYQLDYNPIPIDALPRLVSDVSRLHLIYTEKTM